MDNNSIAIEPGNPTGSHTEEPRTEANPGQQVIAANEFMEFGGVGSDRFRRQRKCARQRAKKNNSKILKSMRRRVLESTLQNKIASRSMQDSPDVV
jgi:hypothetical protein